MDLVSCCIYIIFVFTSFSYFKVPSTCQQNTYDTCQDVQKQKLVQVGTNSYSNFNQTIISSPNGFSQVYSWSTHRCPTLTARTCRSRNAQRCPHQQQCRVWIWIYQVNIFCAWIIYFSIEYWSYFCISRFLNNSANRSPTPRHSRFAEIAIKPEFTWSSTIFLSSSLFTIHPKVFSPIYDSLSADVNSQPSYVAGLRRRPPQDPSESEPDSAKEDVRRCVTAFFLILP